ncbi:DUF924 family protein [Pusillimonas sp. NJUB218]|uniref:DUF924 family protein n=1 Tax=Pusillimonas sp. NJUB218 TaxID=2023230 RepID=UPI000F4B4393|nr:DUF924 family protein [Pusillimonas sp. NJUB218]ROT44427.1 hypothetical protein CHR62_12005 [Pusillimonas sp. NJUB218]
MPTRPNAPCSPEDVLRFWFDELGPKHWFDKSPELDARIKTRFEVTHQAAAQGECFGWRTTPQGRLAEIIVLDQFPRNIFRDQAKAFATDALALVLAQEAVACGADRTINAPDLAFLYMPYMHSESLIIHEEAMHLFNQPGLEGNYEFEIKHKVILEKFGRYPHRNAALGRESTPDEIAFLKQPGSGF